ncbi:hypothetical protein [Muribaculum intestinale]|uniref:hypothetical protein n=2 Tax=Muribaculum intestinale TaxID=1796646 RepID=UPI0025A5DDD6|nr:hypothetical protein [Muribaculum intestinale]
MTTSILWGIGAILVGAVIFWVYESIKATKDPNVQAASKLRISISTYNRLKSLFDAKLQDPFEDAISTKTFIELTSGHTKQWKQICENYAKDYVPFYSNSKEIFVRMEDDNKLIRGTITNNKLYSIDWWHYKVKFDESISINNCYPSQEILLSNRQIRDIEMEILLGSYCHYHF